MANFHSAFTTFIIIYTCTCTCIHVGPGSSRYRRFHFIPPKYTSIESVSYNKPYHQEKAGHCIYTICQNCHFNSLSVLEKCEQTPAIELLCSVINYTSKCVSHCLYLVCLATGNCCWSGCSPAYTCNEL